MNNKNRYVFIIVRYGVVIDRVVLHSDHPYKRDFIYKAKEGLSRVYEIKQDEVLLDESVYKEAERILNAEGE